MLLRNKTLSVLLCLFLLPTMLEGEGSSNNPLRSLRKAERELRYYKQAALLNDLLYKEKVPTRMKTIVVILKEIDKNMPRYYPNGPFTRNDMIALAWLESEFHQFEVGTHKEKGIFQIMPCEFRDFGVRGGYYDVDVNTEMGFKVLRGKYKRFHNYKIAIMAYNGLIKRRNGKYSQRYWKAFQKRRMAVDQALNER